MVFRLPLCQNGQGEAVYGIAQLDEFAVEIMPAFWDDDDGQPLRGAP